jgi:hypothetical protein
VVGWRPCDRGLGVHEREVEVTVVTAVIVEEAEAEREPFVRGGASVRRDGFGALPANRRVLDGKVEVGIRATP